MNNAQNIDSIINLIKEKGLNYFKTLDLQLRSNKDIVLAAINQNPMSLYYASNEFRSNKEIVLSAVKQHGSSLFYASNELKNNKTIVLAAVSQNGYALEYASDKLKIDKNIILAAISQNVNIFTFISQEHQSDINFLRILRDNKSKVLPENTKLLHLKLKELIILEIKEQENWMENNIPKNNIQAKPKKF